MLIAIDETMILENPFTPMTATADPVTWITEVGGTWWNDSVAIGLRGIFLIVGVWLLLKVGNEFVNYGTLIQSVMGAASS